MSRITNTNPIATQADILSPASLSDTPRFITFSTAWSARPNDNRLTIYVGGSPTLNVPNDVNLKIDDVWITTGQTTVWDGTTWSGTAVPPPPPVTVPPSYSSVSGAEGITSAIINIAKPAGITGIPSECVLIFMETRGNATVVPPAGVTEAAGSPITTTGTEAQSLRVFWHRPTAPETSGTYDFDSVSGMTALYGRAILLTGCLETGTPVIGSGFADADNSNNTTPPASINVSANSLAVWIATNFSGTGLSFSGGFTERQDDGQLALATLPVTTSGPVPSSGTLVATTGSNARSTVWLGAVLPKGSTITPPPTVTATPFNHYVELFGDAGVLATQLTTDLLVPSASFRAVTTSSENTYWAAHHSIVLSTTLPHDLLNPASETFLLAAYPSSTDTSWRTTMPALATTYGFNNTFMFLGPEHDNDPANQGWATNRFLEAGVGGSRPDIPTGLTNLAAYTQYMHFYTANNHGGITNHHQLGQIFGPGALARGYKTSGNCAYQSGMCYGFEMGFDLLTTQKNNSDLPGIVGGIGIPRGAANQFGKQWGVDISATSPSGQLSYTGSTLNSGWTTNTYRRNRFLGYWSGADVLAEEAITWTGTATTINGHGYHPGAVELKYFCDFAFNRHPYAHRGVAHVPIAFMKDHISKWEPRGGPNGQSRAVWWWQIGPNNGENMLHNIYEMCYPNYWQWGTGSSTVGAPEPMGQGRWGEQFDVITERSAPSVMSDYRVIILSTDAVMDATLQAALTTYVNAGGIVVINVRQLSGTAHQSLTGITLVGGASTSGTLTWELDGTTTTEATFNYATVTLGTAIRVARTGASTPQVVKNLVGSGEVWTVLSDYMSVASGAPATLGVAAKLVDYFINRFAVATLSGGSHSNIDWAVTKLGGASGLANSVMIINTNDAGGAAWTGTVSLPQGSPVAEWTADATPTSVNVGGRTNITASVPAGDVKVYAVG